MSGGTGALSRGQQLGLVLLRTLVGWHFVYEGYYKLLLPAWGRDGAPHASWSSAGYLAGAGGPFAGVFHALASPSLVAWVDLTVSLGLLLAGLSLMLGLYTRAGGWVALALLALFYLSAIPTRGVPGPGAEGAYLIVNKNLIEAAAVLVLLAFRTERIAGLDLLRRPGTARAEEVTP